MGQGKRVWFAWIRVLRAASGLVEAGVCLTLALAVAGFFGGLHWALDLLAHFRLQALVVLGLAGSLLLCIRRRAPWGLAAVAGAVVLAATLVPHLRQEGSPPEPGTATLRLLGYNVMSQNPEKARVLAYFTEQSADVVLLMEVTAEWVDALAPLAQIYPHRMAAIRSDNFGMLLLSKTPLLDKETHTLSPGVPMMEAQLELSGRRLVIYGVHPVPPVGRQGSRDRGLYLDQLGSRIAASPVERVVVAGDLNATPYSAAFRRFARPAGLCQ
ncbi:hypothetical protein BH23VER1_BH23VER1_30600 [soil metagenome]